MTEYQKLTTYFGERQRSGGAFVADALLELYGRHEIAASILLRGTEGFGLKHHLRTDRSLSLSEDLPLSRWRSTPGHGSRRCSARSSR